MSLSAAPDWIAVDWGSTRLRAWAMDDSGVILASATSDKGMNSLEPHAFEPALIEAIGSWLGETRTEVLACGMVGARQGWQEAPYIAVPTTLADVAPVPVDRVRDARLQVRIVPGLSQARPVDVMRGEETQILGFLAVEPGFDGVLCIPGTHTKWVRLVEGRIEGFRTVMTGEVFELLAGRSILRHSVQGAAMNLDAFDGAVSGSSGTVLRDLFGIRARSLVEGQAPDTCLGQLSGSLIGAELSEMAGFFAGQDLAIVGSETLCDLYARAFAARGRPVRCFSGDSLVCRGLTALYRQHRG